MLDGTHTHYGVKMGATLLSGISALRIPVSAKQLAEIADGSVYPRSIYHTDYRPTFEFTSLGVADAIDALVAEGGSLQFGMPIAAAKTLIGYAQARAEGAARQTGASHRSHTASKGLLLPQSLECSQGSDAQLSFLAIVLYDGSNDPVIFADSVALPAGLDDLYRFGLGPVTIGGTALSGIDRLSLNFGVSAEPEAGDGDNIGTTISIQHVEPTLTLTGKKITLIKQSTHIPFFGSAATHANTDIYLRRRQPDSAGSVSASAGYYPNASAEHVLFNMLGAVRPTTLFDSDGNNAATNAIEVKGHTDAAGLHSILAATGQAIA